MKEPLNNTSLYDQTESVFVWLPVCYLCVILACVIVLCTQVQYNQAFALMKQGRNVEAMDELMKAKTKAATFTESRHKIIAPALESMRVRGMPRDTGS